MATGCCDGTGQAGDTRASRGRDGAALGGDVQTQLVLFHIWAFDLRLALSHQSLASVPRPNCKVKSPESSESMHHAAASLSSCDMLCNKMRLGSGVL